MIPRDLISPPPGVYSQKLHNLALCTWCHLVGGVEDLELVGKGLIPKPGSVLQSGFSQVLSLLCAAFSDSRTGLITSSEDDKGERRKKPSPLMFVRMQDADPDLHNPSACKLQRAVPQDSIWAHPGWLANHCLHQGYEHHCKANRLADAPYLE